ncbi:MAG: hypothetical protein HY982_02025, partial [Candidatus Magasanikbacteria bacterium]|nr:hypothetical protein [Candidatus Magasanikbacteria bacterium]
MSSQAKIGFLLVAFLTALFLTVGLGGSVFAKEAPSVSEGIYGQLGAAAEKSGLTATDPRETVTRIIFILLGVLGTVFLGLIVYAGYLWLTAGGEEEKIREAKKYLFNGVIGLIIILAAFGITILVSVYAIRVTGNKYYQPTAPGVPPVPI